MSPVVPPMPPASMHCAHGEYAHASRERFGGACLHGGMEVSSAPDQPPLPEPQTRPLSSVAYSVVRRACRRPSLHIHRAVPQQKWCRPRIGSRGVMLGSWQGSKPFSVDKKGACSWGQEKSRLMESRAYSKMPRYYQLPKTQAHKLLSTKTCGGQIIGTRDLAVLGRPTARTTSDLLALHRVHSPGYPMYIPR